MKISFARSQSESVNLKEHVIVCLTESEICTISERNLVACPRGIMQFLGGGGDCFPELRNLWAELQR